MFPLSTDRIALILGCPKENVAANWPLVEQCMEDLATLDPLLQTDAAKIAALATIRVEAPPFKPIHEFGKKPYFARYDHRKDLGNDGDGVGYIYRGAGLIQITGLDNFRRYGKLLGIDMVDDPNDPTDNDDPNKAIDPNVAASIFASYFLDHHVAQAAVAGDWQAVRRKVNGGLNGFSDFIHYIYGLQAAIAEAKAASA